MAYEQARERIRRIGQIAADSRALRSDVLAEINRVVAFDAYVWPLTDPETSVGVAPLAAMPPALMPSLPRLIRLKYVTDLNRWTSLSGHTARLADPARSLVWRELLSGHGVSDVASTVFRDRYGCWAFLDLWRTGGTFTRAETSFMDSITDMLTADLRRCQAETFGSPPAPRPPSTAVLLLSADLQVQGQTPQTHEYLKLLVPPNTGMAPIPASAYNVAAQLIAVEQHVDANPPTARVHLADGRWLSLRAARLGPEAQIAVTIEDASPRERMVVFARAFGLSTRETELLAHLITGADTHHVAGRMFLSENTVQDHLKSIFTKTGTRNRRTLLSRAVGTG